MAGDQDQGNLHTKFPPLNVDFSSLTHDPHV